MCGSVGQTGPVNLSSAFRAAQDWFNGLHSAAKAALLGILFICVVGAIWNATVAPEEFEIVEINPTADFISTWPSGPLAGVAPLVVGQPIDVDDCTTLGAAQTVEVVPHEETSAFWLRATEADKIVLSWIGDGVEQKILVPESQLTHEFEPGRVTVTLTGANAGQRLQVDVEEGGAQLCGVQSNADRDGGPLAETDLLSSWPSGPLAGQPPVARDVSVDADGCADVPPAGLDIVPDSATAAVWVFSDADAIVRVDWVSDIVEQSLRIPSAQFANEFEQGRVTVTLSDAPAGREATVVQVRADRGAARVCGISAS